MKFRVVPYLRGSQSAKLLADNLTEVLGYKVFRGAPKDNRKNIFWGARVPALGTVINEPSAIDVARNKIRTFQALEGHVAIPQFTTSKEVAEGWLSGGAKVLARSSTGQGGSGITVCSDSLVDAPLYTLYIKKRKEFRVHVIGSQAVFVQEKRKRRGGDTQPDPIIRSHDRGWVFCTRDIEEPAGLRELAINAVTHLGLDFGAVDIIWNQHQNQCYVLEVNTAPGLCPTSGMIYANQISSSF